MDEVRSYWQVASITHFCEVFNKQFKLPEFEPEELEQAFILDIVIPPKPNNHRGSAIKEELLDEEGTNNDHDETKDEGDKFNESKDDRDDEDYRPSNDGCQNEDLLANPTQPIDITQPQNGVQNSRLVNLAIALLQPHFNTSLNYYNWENYLNRIIDANWVGLEQQQSPLRKISLGTDGVETVQNLTFNDLNLSDRIDVIHALCDYRFWCEDVQDKLKDFPVEELRLEPIGKDTNGYEYWYFSGTRLFRENKELSQDITSRKQRIIELEDRLVELDKSRISREQEEKKKADLEKAKQLAAEAREAKRKQQELETRSRRKQATPVLPLRTGLRERRSSTVSNNNHHHTNDDDHDSTNDTNEEIRIPTTRSKVAKQKQIQQPQTPVQQKDVITQNGTAKVTRNSTSRNTKSNGKRQNLTPVPSQPKKSAEEECREELERIQITPEERKEAWCIECESLEEWEQFATRFEKTKSTNEKYLSNYVNEYILPKIRAIYAKKAAEIRRKEKELLYSLASRRVSTRLVSKKAQEEDEERRAEEREAENRRKKAEAEQRLRAELEREMRVRQNRFVINGVGSTCSEDNDDDSSSCRYNTRQQHELDESDEFAGIIHPDKLSLFYEALELIVDTVRTSKHAWPFVDPVDKSVDGYYDLITEPMDLKKLRTKVEFREYRSCIELERDFQLIVNNCEKFNGPKNIYTKMVYKLWKSFRRNVKLYLQRDLEMNEYETFIYPPLPPNPSNQPNPPHPPNPPNLPNSLNQLCHADRTKESESPSPQNQTDSPSAQDLPSQPDPLSPPNSTILPETSVVKQEQIENQGGLPHDTCVIIEEPCEDIIIDSYDVACPEENFFTI